jgi:AcrR family transcriptional regulator
VNRDEIVDTARRLVETGGVDALSMRKLAAELGVAPTAIYWHVGGREQLMGEIVDELIAEMAEIKASGRTPPTRVTSIARAIRAQVRNHPYLVQLANELGRGPATYFPGQLALAREMTAAGLTGEEAARAVRAVLFLVGGFIMVEGHEPAPSEVVTSQDLWREVDDPRIDAGLLTAMQQPPDTDDLFEYALSRLLPSILPESSR